WGQPTFRSRMGPAHFSDEIGGKARMWPAHFLHSRRRMGPAYFERRRLEATGASPPYGDLGLPTFQWRNDSGACREECWRLTRDKRGQYFAVGGRRIRNATSCEKRRRQWKNRRSHFGLEPKPSRYPYGVHL